ncbi:MAG: histidine ammonia-lyase [Euryarchaeota archaeon]|nr:histidine ammonia-lyase [Euryarchaeota archaeon]
MGAENDLHRSLFPRPVPDQEVVLSGGALIIEEVVRVARGHVAVRLDDAAVERIGRSRAIVDDLVARREVAYGITTGFGEFAHVSIDVDKVEDLQRNLIMSHSVGLGDPLPHDVVRAMMLIRAESLALGVSGVRLATVRLLLEMLARDVVPVVPEKGSLGASGDLAPLAHMVLPMIGLGEAFHDGKRMSGAEAMAAAGLKPITLGAKEGLALINGTCLMSAYGALLVHDAERLMANAIVSGAMSLEALEGTDQAFIPEVSLVRPHPGQTRAAEALYALTQESGIMQGHRDCPKVQDAYTLRCMPQVYGAVLDAIAYVRRVVAIEIRSATDNPLVLSGRGGVSCGNFHGEPLALALDFLTMALSEVANMTERRIDRLVNPHVSGMTAFLVEAGGLNSGYMVAQYTAAALVAENKVLAHPASVDSIPTSANQEDHVSMGATAAVKAARVLDNVWKTVAIEYMCAAQGIDFKRPRRAGPGVEAAHAVIRAHVPRLERDRVLAPDVGTIEALMHDDAVVQAVRSAGFGLDVRLDTGAVPTPTIPDHPTPDPVKHRKVGGGTH